MSALVLADERVQLERLKRSALQKSSWESKAMRSTIECDGTEGRFFIPPHLAELPMSLSLVACNDALLETRLNDLNVALTFNDIDSTFANIEPKISLHGSDPNHVAKTREAIARHFALDEQTRLIDLMHNKINMFEVPQDIKNQKCTRKIIIPVDEYPDYSFMGLIIGPRGCNHRRLEFESRAQISVRGRGTQKDLGRVSYQSLVESQMPLHVHVTADSEDKVNRAVALLEPLLDPTHPGHDDYRQRGLQQLASVRGSPEPLEETVSQLASNRDVVTCTVCGETGHYGYECVNVQTDAFETVQVTCLLCGDQGHVTSDCFMARELSEAELSAIISSARQ